MELSKIVWAVLVVISLGVAYLAGAKEEPGFVIGTALGTFLFPAIILGLVILIGKLFKTPPSRTTRRVVFLSLWGFTVLSQLPRVGMNRRQTKAALMASCIQACRDSADYDIGALMDLNKYCECALSRIIEQHGFDSSGIQNLKDRNSVLFNELAVTCVEAAMYQAMDRKGSVAGMHNSDTIAVLNADRGYKVKITVGNEQAYFLFDSGASDILVSTDFEKKMNENGAIQGYLENMSYELANGDLIDCKRAIVNDIQIGEFLVDSVVVAIYDRDIGFLLGKSFMDKFSSWKFIDNGNALVLVK